MDKLLGLLNLEALKGSRTKLCLLLAGAIGFLVQFGLITQEQADVIIKLGLPFGFYFAVEHWSPKKV